MTLEWLFLEVFGQSGLGGGAMRLVAMDIKKFQILAYSIVKKGFDDKK